MTTTPHYHIGILVNDIDSARVRFGLALGVDFAEVTERTIEFSGHDPGTSIVKLCYSVQGPPYYELIQSVDGGLFDHHRGEGLHHVGVFVGDGAAQQQALEAMGVDTEYQMVRVRGPLGETTNLAWFNDPNGLHGVRFEFVDDVVRPQLESWLSSLGASPIDEPDAG